MYFNISFQPRSLKSDFGPVHIFVMMMQHFEMCLRLTQTSLRELQLGLRVCETCFKRDFGVQSRILDDRCGFSSWWCKNLNVTKSRFLWFFTIGPSLRSSSFNSREENPSLVPKLWRTKIWQLFWFLAFLALFGTRGWIYVKTGGTPHLTDMAVWFASNPPNLSKSAKFVKFLVVKKLDLFEA